MPFSKYDMGNEHIEAMRVAYRRICDVLQLDCRREDPMTEIIVMKIVELAEVGEYDPMQVSERVLADLKASHSGIRT
jgi:hypothetical protein